MLELLNVRDFESFYALMETSFPLTERRTKAGQHALFEADCPYRLYGTRNQHTHTVEAFLAVWEFEDLLFLEHFAVDPALRGQGLGAKLLGELASATKKTVCLEVEPPDNETAIRRIGFYKRNGFFLNEYPYIQPPLTEGQPPIPLMIMTYGHPITQDTFEQIREELYREVYHVSADYAPNRSSH